jgi:hypothetical protein
MNEETGIENGSYIRTDKEKGKRKGHGKKTRMG